MPEDERKLETVRITNSPVLTFKPSNHKLISPLCRQSGPCWLPAVQGDDLGCGIPPGGVAHMTAESTSPGRSQAQDASTGDQPPDRARGTGSGGQGGTGSVGWLNNLHIGALIFGGVSTILVALRLLSIAKANPETAFAILQAGGTTNVVMGTVLSLIPSIALIGASYLAIGRIWAKFSDSKFPDSSKLTDAEELGIWTSMSALFLIAILTIPFRYWEAPVAVLLALILARIFRESIERARKNKKDNRWWRVVKVTTAGLIAFAFLLGVIISPPWMPAEQLTFTTASKDKPVVGYVLDQSQSGLTVLSINPTQVLYYGPKDLTTEFACSAFRSDDLPIIYHTGLIRIFHLFSYPHCK